MKTRVLDIENSSFEPEALELEDQLRIQKNMKGFHRGQRKNKIFQGMKTRVLEVENSSFACRMSKVHRTPLTSRLVTKSSKLEFWLKTRVLIRSIYICLNAVLQNFP